MSLRVLHAPDRHAPKNVSPTLPPQTNLTEQSDIVLKQLKRRLRERIQRGVPNKEEFQTLLERLNQANSASPKLQSQLLIWSVQLLNGGKAVQTSFTTPEPDIRSEPQLSPDIHVVRETPAKKTINITDSPVVEIPVVSKDESTTPSQSTSKCELSLSHEYNHGVLGKPRQLVEVEVSNKSPRKRQKAPLVIIEVTPTKKQGFTSPGAKRSKTVTTPGKVVKITEQSRSQTGRIMYRVSWEDGSQSWESPKNLTSALDLVEKYEHRLFRRYDSPRPSVSNRRQTLSSQTPTKQYLTDSSVEEFPHEQTLTSELKPLRRFLCVEVECIESN
ncbi:hypothetical protein K493DRAFT_337838 [Basidiobolus meristosporus CBS 931.73]|uniref:Chromo domain-containing protein n=1 Tax=Basidiobolus meristosporus CBS 931.73 TaxID=1314790 RepID=A0A1Y1Y8L8_9FUNG|nr:hypothetical protein K493DRAFT_337838 [Basidiobolus meristosporus CBS 931.73]|eukprot:ORX94337.1 hypothetical protein K493DRAFT_337838 [Basidiobolus meristosporus CBS 931.73]